MIFSLQVYRLKPERNLTVANLGNINWENLACLAIIYLICYFSMWKGVKTSGKVKTSTEADKRSSNDDFRLFGLRLCFRTLF